jgi:hypothetical protein
MKSKCSKKERKSKTFNYMKRLIFQIYQLPKDQYGINSHPKIREKRNQKEDKLEITY